MERIFSWSLSLIAPIEPGIVCRDLERMVSFYTGVLGLSVLSDAAAKAEMSAAFGTTPHGYRIVRLQAASGERVKLIQVTRATSSAIENKAPEWVFDRQGIAYLTFIVSNLDDVMTRLRECKVAMMRPAPVSPRKGFIAVFAIDPEGNFLEFVQYDDITAYRPASPTQQG